MDNIGKTIRELRKAKRYTQADVAARLRMSRATISGIENGTEDQRALMGVVRERLANPQRVRVSLDDL